MTYEIPVIRTAEITLDGCRVTITGGADGVPYPEETDVLKTESSVTLPPPQATAFGWLGKSQETQ